MIFADLHTHTYFSDGILSPEELLKKAIDKNIDLIAITDHDTLDGYYDAQKIVEKYKIHLIPGIELSTKEGSSEFHLLGYNFDVNSDELQSCLNLQKFHRIERAKKISLLLKEMDIILDVEELTSKNSNAALTRPHIASYLFEKGYVSTTKEAFNLYIGDRSPAFVEKTALSIKDAIKLIHKSGGFTSIAHPSSWVSNSAISKFAYYGLDSIETIHPMHSSDTTEKWSSIAKRYNLFQTGGSDFHGSRDWDEMNFGKYYYGYENMDEIVNYKSKNIESILTIF